MAAGGNLNALNREVGVDGRDWSFGLFDCFSECDLYIWAVLCPCVVYSKSNQRLQHLRDRGTPLPGGGERYTTDCCVHGTLMVAGVAWILQIGTTVGTRSDIRSRYSIRGDTIGDCVTSWIFHSCSLTQERREIELEENSFRVEGFSQSK